MPQSGQTQQGSALSCVAAPGWYLKVIPSLGCSWCRRGPPCGLHLTSPHKRHSAPGWGKGQRAEQASHQPEGVQPDTASQELSGIPWGEMGPTITDSNWKTLKGLTRVSACLTDSRVYSCQREPGDCKLGLFSRCEYICPSPVYIAVLISIHVSESESFLC